MRNNVESKYNADNTSIIIVVSEFNKSIIENLLNGALNAYVYHGGDKSEIKVYRVPGAFEIPGTIIQILKNKFPNIF